MFRKVLRLKKSIAKQKNTRILPPLMAFATDAADRYIHLLQPMALQAELPLKKQAKN
jgi:hypothetical protein